MVWPCKTRAGNSYLCGWLHGCSTLKPSIQALSFEGDDVDFDHDDGDL